MNLIPGQVHEQANPTAFRSALDVAFYRAAVRRIKKEQSDTVSKATDPGKFKDERNWPEWEPAFANADCRQSQVSMVSRSHMS